MTDKRTRRKRSRGTWMQVRDTELLVKYMQNADFTQARLARYVGCSRQFIHLLASGQRTTCTKQVGELVEEALRVLPGTLFIPRRSRTTDTVVKKKRTTARKAS